MPKAKQVAKTNGDAAIVAEGKMGRSTWKGSLMIGAITMPVALFTAARGERISFNMLHAACCNKVKQAGYYCPCCVVVKALKPITYTPRDSQVAMEVRVGDKVVMHADDANMHALAKKVVITEELAMLDDSDVIKGYEHADGQFVVITKEDIESQKPQSSSTLEISSFINDDELNPIYFESSYYLAADAAVKNKSFSLLLKGMITKRKVAVAKVTIRQQENVVFLRPHPDGGFVAFTAYMVDEVKQVKFQPLADVTQAEMDAVGGFIDAMSSPLDMKTYTDSYRENMLKLIEAKKEGKAPEKIESKPLPEQKDNLLEMLTASTIAVKQQKKAKAA